MESIERPWCTLTQATGTTEGQLTEINSFDLRSETFEEPLGGLECWKYNDHIALHSESVKANCDSAEEKTIWTSPCWDEGTLFHCMMELKWWWYHQLETAQIFISLWQVGRETPQVKQTVSQMSLQIRDGSSGDFLLEAHGAGAERHHPERWEQLWAELPGWIQGPGAARHHSLGLLSTPALCFPLNRRNVGTWILEDPGQEPSVGSGALWAHFADHQNTLISPCFAGGWSQAVHFMSPCFDFCTCKEQARTFPSFKKYLIISFQKCEAISRILVISWLTKSYTEVFSDSCWHCLG